MAAHWRRLESSASGTGVAGVEPRVRDHLGLELARARDEVDAQVDRRPSRAANPRDLPGQRPVDHRRRKLQSGRCCSSSSTGREQVAVLLHPLEHLAGLEHERVGVAASASSTSSHRTGVDTVGRSRARRE